MTHTEGASPQPEPAPRWRAEDGYLYTPAGAPVADFVAEDAESDLVLATLNAAEDLRVALTRARDYFAKVPAAKATGADPIWLYVNSVLAGDASDEMLPEMFPRYGDLLKERDDIKKQTESLRARVRVLEDELRSWLAWALDTGAPAGAIERTAEMLGEQDLLGETDGGAP